MLSVRLVRVVERHADEVTHEVVRELQASPRTPAFHSLPAEELRRRIHHLLRNLGQWVKERSQPKVAAFYEELGRRRFHEGVPMSELAIAFALIKRGVRSHVLASVAPASAVELYQLEEFEVLIDGFFDEALYHTVKGWEAAVGGALQPVLAGSDRGGV